MVKETRKHTSFYMTPFVRGQLDELCEYYQENASKVICRLINDAQVRLSQTPLKKERKK